MFGGNKCIFCGKDKKLGVDGDGIHYEVYKEGGQWYMKCRLNNQYVGCKVSIEGKQL